MTQDRRPRGLLRLAVAAIGAHSCVLGIAMLVQPIALTELLGFTPPENAFFPSQAGVFLLVLGVCELLALRDTALVAVILVSKPVAVVFLVVHAVFLGAPPMVWAAAVGDAAMLALTLFALRRSAARARGDARP